MIIIIIIIVIILLLSLQFTNQLILFSDFCEFSASSHHLIIYISFFFLDIIIFFSFLFYVLLIFHDSFEFQLIIKNIINHLYFHVYIGGNHANGTRMLSCIVSSIIIYLCFFQIIVNYFIIVLLYRNKLFLILILIFMAKFYKLYYKMHHKILSGSP